MDVEIEIWSWGATIRGPLAAEVRVGAGRDGAPVIRRLDAALVERSIPANGRGRLVVVWDGRDAAGQLAPAGTYWIALVFDIERPGRSASSEEVGSAVRLARP